MPTESRMMRCCSSGESELKSARGLEDWQGAARDSGIGDAWDECGGVKGAGEGERVDPSSILWRLR